MTLVIANKPVMGRGDLTETTRFAMAFVDGGLEWVDWAGQSGFQYAFPDESRLIDGVQQGLHGSPYTVLPMIGLMVGPVKLQTMDPADLRVLAQAETTGTGDPTLAAQLSIILSRNKLVTAQDLAGVQNLLTQLGVAGNPLFQALDLRTTLTLHGMLGFPDAGGSGPTNQTAAQFAVQQARTAAEFADYYTAFLGYVTRMSAQSAPAATQTEMASTALTTLLPLLFSTLECPSVAGLVGPGEVAAAVQAWQRQGQQVGFARLSEAVATIMIYSNYTGGNAAQAQQTINDYMGSWQSFLAANLPSRGQMAQDGATCLFPIENNGLYGELVLGPDGSITTRLFRRQAASPVAMI
ncbi:hypothetical protein [Niveispirillum irakense]|uniref:hypothetical protein n=1 Tax=Niveispirillum irakense TaxID=34011 RepID=UPI0004184CBB|nr:hypothetical protein [Niveispirillum irakense]